MQRWRIERKERKKENALARAYIQKRRLDGGERILAALAIDGETVRTNEM